MKQYLTRTRAKHSSTRSNSKDNPINTVFYTEITTSSRIDSPAPSGPILVAQPTMTIQFVTKYLLKEHAVKNSQ